jgi:hypothetical protein
MPVASQDSVRDFARLVEDCHVVKRYPYRTARVAEALPGMSFEDTSGVARDVKGSLADRLRVAPDNHEVYEVVLRDGRTVYILFHDSYVTLGTRVIEGNW